MRSPAGCRLWAVLILLPASVCNARSPLDTTALTAPPVVAGLGQLQSQTQPASSEGTTTASTPSPSTAPVGIKAALSHSLFARKSPERLILKIDLHGSGSAPRVRPALNLAVVLDRSGSMDEDRKFEFALKAAGLVFENLTEQDIVSLIAFNQSAVVLSPAGRAVNKAFLDHRLSDVHPDGWTNLSAGLLEAYAQIESAVSEGQTKRVIVLTDGLANRGITDPAKLRHLVAHKHGRGIGVSTLGVGTKFDEKLLQNLADSGGGRYTYVVSPEDIPGAMSAELEGLLEVVAQNVRLVVKATEAANITRVYGRLIDPAVSSYSFTLGDFRQRERGVELLELTPQKLNDGGSAGAEIELTLDNPETGDREQQVLRLQATFTPDAARAQASKNETVVLYAAVRDAVEKAEEAVLGLDVERYRETTRSFDKLYERARRHAVETRDQELLNQTFVLKHFTAELSAAQEAGLLHGHKEAQDRLKKDVDYRRYLLEHHRGGR